MSRRRPQSFLRGDAAAPPPPAAAEAQGHVPVLIDAVIGALAPRHGALYVDGTFGAGGYSQALLTAAKCRVVAIDRDPEAVRRGHELARAYCGRLAMLEGNFGDLERLLGASIGSDPLAGITLDLGVSSVQLDNPERGFSFRFDGPLDMRMGAAGQTAADLVAVLPEDELARLIGELGEERFARRVARAIVAGRRRGPICRTLDLARIVRAAVPSAEPGLDSATRTFQALRIAVNDELGELDRGLEAAERLLMPGGRLAVVSFHSLEDRRVKEFLRRRSGSGPGASRYEPVPRETEAASFRLLHRRAIKPTAEETARNPRARSARLRAAERTAAPPRPPARGRQRGQAA
jgi:16S rRNA (cytosine1402-N4)-methyltransferase